tara:strand:+ start:445 stop:1473 length:1029 start_codon:yes stop_codon:yes gene_type:complete
MLGNQWHRKEHPLLSLLGMGGGAGSPASTAGGIPETGPAGITATGGTKSTSVSPPDGVTYTVHTFTSSGTFSVTAATGTRRVEYLVVGGGGSGPNGNGGGAGGGGAGGYRANVGTVSPAAEPSGGGASAEDVFLCPSGNYTVTIGGGGAYTNSNIGNAGSNSVFSTITSIGGGKGNCSDPAPNDNGGTGGSGGGGGEFDGPQGVAGEGTTGQGHDGGTGLSSGTNAGGGGGGAGAVGGNGDSTNGSTPARQGGIGVQSWITGTHTRRGGGGGASGNNRAGGNGGLGGGGNGGGGSGGPGNSPSGLSSGSTNYGGGGGARYNNPNHESAGGSGIVVIRYQTST